jgi:potassium efflux system protein
MTAARCPAHRPTAGPDPLAATAAKRGALMDFALLRRLQVRPDANYATKTVTRHALVGVGAALAQRMLGVDRDRVHWLLAALGAGLGFGLQEIVADFASRLIVVAERPIRIGGVFTVGEITGTVARIRARATSVPDLDSREVMIPNKAFVAERVTNRTLSNRPTRLLVKVGVAYGSDVTRVPQLLLDAARAPGGVLAEPPPTVSCVEFGESAPGCEIRVYVDSIGQRLLAQHDLHVAVERTLREAGIAIAFPHRDVHLVPAPVPGPAPAG